MQDLEKQTILEIIILVRNQEQVKSRENSDASESVSNDFPRMLEVNDNSVSVGTIITKCEEIRIFEKLLNACS